MSLVGIEGDPDLYGLGVRIGLYSAWFATLLTSIWDQESENDARIGNLIVQFAIFIGLCVDSGKEHSSGVSSVITQFLLCRSLSSGNRQWPYPLPTHERSFENHVLCRPLLIRVLVLLRGPR